MRKKHGTVRTAVRPSGSVNRDRFTRFGRFPNFSLFFFFFFPLNGVVLNSSNVFFFTLLYGVVLPLSKSLFWNGETLISHFSSPILVSASLKSSSETLLYSSLPLSNPHTRAVAPSQLILSPSRRRTVVAQSLSRRTSHFVAQSLSRRTSQLSLSPASPSQRSLDRSVVVAVAAQPRY